MIKKSILILLIFSFFHSDESKTSLFGIHFGFSPTSNFQIRKGETGRNRNYAFGLSIPFHNFRLGMDISQIVWTSYRFYSFKKHLLYENQNVGNTDDLNRHRLIGLAPYIEWTLNEQGHFWEKTVFTGGLFFGHPDTPNKLWYKKWGRITDTVTINLFFQLSRPLFLKYPWIVGTYQLAFIPYYGVNSSLLLEIRFSLF